MCNVCNYIMSYQHVKPLNIAHNRIRERQLPASQPPNQPTEELLNRAQLHQSALADQAIDHSRLSHPADLDLDLLPGNHHRTTRNEGYEPTDTRVLGLADASPCSAVLDLRTARGSQSFVTMGYTDPLLGSLW